MHFLHFGIIETTQRSRCLRHMRVSKVYPGNPVGIMHVWCLMGQVLGFTPLHLPLCLRQWRQGRPDGANAFVTQENHESVCAWRATVSILGNGFTCTCPCQDLKFWRFEVSVFLKTIMLRPFFGVFWHMCSCCTVCQQFYSEKFSGCLGCVPILKMQSLHMWSKAIPSIVVHRCTFTVTLASASDLICVFLVCTNALFVFATMRKRTVCICILWTHNVFAYSQPTLLLIAVFGTSTVCVQVSRKRRKIMRSRDNSEEWGREGVYIHCTAILMKAMHVIRQLQKPLIPSCKLAKAEINIF